MWSIVAAARVQADGVRALDEMRLRNRESAHAGVATGEGHFADVDPVHTHPDAMIDVGDPLQRHFDFGIAGAGDVTSGRSTT